MPVYVEGALIGIAIGAVLVAFEYFALKKDLKERGIRLHKTFEMDATEKNRIKSVLRFSVLLPIGFAIGFWIIWG